MTLQPYSDGIMGSTIKDVAAAAGVSTATVSRVINNPEQVSPETRQRIEKIIEEQDYRPNIFARGLMKSRTDSVGILVSHLVNPYITSIVDTMESILTRSGTFIYLCNCKQAKPLEREYTAELLRRKVDALIIVETLSFSSPDNFFIDFESPCPIILVNEHLATSTRHHIVRCDQEPGIKEALNLLFSKELFPIALFVGDPHQYSFKLKERLFLEFKRERGLSDSEVQIHYLFGETNYEDIVPKSADYAFQLFTGRNRPRSILAGNDLIALGVLQAAQKTGIKIPDELSVISVDNTLLSRTSLIPLSSIDLRTEDVGRMAAELYLKLRNSRQGPAEPIHETIPSFLRLRATT
jgi:LacI family transcriptional regulator